MLWGRIHLAFYISAVLCYYRTWLLNTTVKGTMFSVFFLVNDTNAEQTFQVLVSPTFCPGTTASFFVLKKPQDLQMSLHMCSLISYYYQHQLFRSVSLSSSLQEKRVSAPLRPQEGCPKTLPVKNHLLFFCPVYKSLFSLRHIQTGAAFLLL